MRTTILPLAPRTASSNRELPPVRFHAAFTSPLSPTDILAEKNEGERDMTHGFEAQLISAPGMPRGRLRRSGPLTPYALETIAEDARGAGQGARLELIVASHVDDVELAALRDRFAWLGARGLRLRIRRGGLRRGASKKKPPLQP
jgi:hypothetical protein